MTCFEMQQMIRAKMLDSIHIEEKDGKFWMTCSWANWFQLLSRKPDISDRLEFIGQAVHWVK